MVLESGQMRNHRQKVFNRGLYVCAGDLTFQKFTKLLWFVVFRILIWGDLNFVWGD